MDMHDMRNNGEFDKVVELLTPRYPRKCTFSFDKKKRDFKKIFVISSIAAMIAIILTISLKPFFKVSAAEIIQESISNISNARSLRVDFTIRAVKSSDEGVYKPDPNGNMVNATMYILRKDGKQYTRIDWHDKEGNTIIYKNGNYIHIKNGIKMEERESAFPDEIMDIFNIKHLPKDIKDKSEIASDGNLITMELCKDPVTFKGVFRRDTEKLVSASVTLSNVEKIPVTILETKEILTNINLPENLFSE